VRAIVCPARTGIGEERVAAVKPFGLYAVVKHVLGDIVEGDVG
jgi:hypothetical protein